MLCEYSGFPLQFSYYTFPFADDELYFADSVNVETQHLCLYLADDLMISLQSVYILVDTKYFLNLGHILHTHFSILTYFT